MDDQLENLENQLKKMMDDQPKGDIREVGVATDQPPGRMRSRNIIEQRIKKLRRESDELAALLEFIPDGLSPEADNALWRLLVNGG